MRIDDVINIVESEKNVLELIIRSSCSCLKQMILSHEVDLCDRIIRKINEYYIHSKDIKINTRQDETGSKSKQD